MVFAPWVPCVAIQNLKRIKDALPGNVFSLIALPGFLVETARQTKSVSVANAFWLLVDKIFLTVLVALTIFVMQANAFERPAR